MPPLLADFSHARACKPFCEKYLTLPMVRVSLKDLWKSSNTNSLQAASKASSQSQSQSVTHNKHWVTLCF